MTLVGHEAAVAALLAAARSGRLHHAWLVAGAKGIGKAAFADRAAVRLLAEAADPGLAGEGLDVPAAHPTATLARAGSHPDLVRLERLPNEKTGTLARSIRIDQVRGLERRFATRPSFSDRRVVVVDAIDELEGEARHAILKMLEEPPAGTLFLLVSHAPGRLLPTIRSRCRLLRLDPLSEAEVETVLAGALPDTGPDERRALARIAGGAPGTALRFAGLDVAGLDATMDQLVRHGDPTNALRSALAKALSPSSAQPRYEVFLERAPGRLAAEAKARDGAAMAEAIALWSRARAIAGAALPLSADVQTTVFELGALLTRLQRTN